MNGRRMYTSPITRRNATDSAARRMPEPIYASAAARRRVRNLPCPRNPSELEVDEALTVLDSPDQPGEQQDGDHRRARRHGQAQDDEMVLKAILDPLHEEQR